MKKFFVLKTLVMLCVFMAGMGSVCAQNTIYTKWKRVSLTDLQTGDTVVIVDLKKSVAVSNDKGSSKAPAGVSVELNDEKYRITGEVDNKVKWGVVATENGYKFKKPSSENDFLYGDSVNGLRVGTGADNEFNLLNGFLHMAMDDENYYVGLKDSFISSSWAFLAEKDGAVDASINKTQIAFFRRVETTAQDIDFAFPFKNYQCDRRGLNADAHYKYWFNLEVNTSCPEDISNLITYTSSNPDVAKVVTYQGSKRVKTDECHAGVATITAYFPGLVTDGAEYDDAYATCTVRVEELYKGNTYTPAKGLSYLNPFTVSEAIEFAKTEGRVEDGTCYYIQGKVSKVNSGFMALFSEFGLDELLGDKDLDFDFDIDMDAAGISGSSIPGFGDSGVMTYFISDDASKGNQMKVVKGNGLVINSDDKNCGVEFGTLEDNQLSPGDDVFIYGPLIYSEDSNILSSTSGDEEGDEPKKSVKVDELNYISSMNKLLMAEDITMFVDETKTLNELYSLTSTPEGVVEPATVKSGNTDIAAWVKNDAGTDSVFTALKEGNVKVTVKVKVTLAEDDPNTEENEAKTYTMKRKFNLQVKSRDVEPLGKNDGEYVLAHNVGELYDGDRLILVGSNATDEETKNYAMASDDAMMGGGKSGKEVTVEQEKLSNLPEGAVEIILEQDASDASIWYLNVGTNDNGEKLYLYASDNTTEEEEESTGEEEESGFDISQFLNLFGGSSSGLKVGTKDAAGDSCQVSIAIGAEGATIQFNVPNKKNTLRMGNAMDGLMDMLGSFMNKESEGESEEPGNTQSTTGSMGSFNFFMANFNCYGEEETKGSMPSIYHFVPASEFEIYISNLHWTTLYSEYDVLLPEEEYNKLAVYEVSGIDFTKFGPVLQLEEVEDVKAHVPYLVKGVNRDGTFTLRRVMHQSGNNMPLRNGVNTTNLLQVSDATTGVGAYLLDSDGKGNAGMKRSDFGLIGSGHVYLPEDVVTDGSTFVPLESSLPTSITDVNRDGDAANNRAYDLHGRDVTNVSKPAGIYIINGKKVIIK